MTESPIDGILAFLFLAALPLTLIAMLVVRPLYRRAVERGMREIAPPSAYPLPQIRSADPRNLRLEDAPPPAPRLQWLLGLRFLLTGAAFATVASLLHTILAAEGFFPTRMLVIGLIYLWPAVPFALQAAGVRWIWCIAGGVAAALPLILLDPALLIALAVLAGPGALAALLLANRRFRTTALILYLCALAIALALMFTLDTALALVVVLPGLVGTSAEAILVSGAVLLAAAVAACWGLLRLIGWTHARASEIVMQADALWLLMTFWLVVGLVTNYQIWGLLGVLAFIAYRLTLGLLSLSVRRGPPPEPLLLLRVFGNRARQARIADAVLLDWRRRGPVVMIGAEDVATEALDAQELIAFLTGRLRTLFIRRPEDLAHVLEQPERRALDGLYPVRDFYCHSNTWQAVVQILMSRAEAVVLDAGGFGKPAPGGGSPNQGVVFEINQMMRRVDPARIRVFHDGETDQDLLRRKIHAAWDAFTGRVPRRGEVGLALIRFD